MSDQFDAKAFLKTVTSQPGVYRMYDAGGTVIYVGKAKDLKKRLSSYFRSNLASRKTEALVAQIQQIDVTVLASVCPFPPNCSGAAYPTVPRQTVSST